MPNVISQALQNQYCFISLYDLAMSIGTRLRQLRLSKKLSGTKFGELCGVTKGTVSLWESDATMPSIPNLLKLHDELHFSLDWLLAGEDEARAAYTTADPKLIGIIKALQQRADYVKESALENVLNTCKLDDQMRQHASPGLIGERMAPNSEKHDRASDWITGVPTGSGKLRKGGKQ